MTLYKHINKHICIMCVCVCMCMHGISLETLIAKQMQLLFSKQSGQTRYPGLEHSYYLIERALQVSDETQSFHCPKFADGFHTEGLTDNAESPFSCKQIDIGCRCVSRLPTLSVLSQSFIKTVCRGSERRGYTSE